MIIETWWTKLNLYHFLATCLQMRLTHKSSKLKKRRLKYFKLISNNCNKQDKSYIRIEQKNQRIDPLSKTVS